ncbi:MAG: recombination protein RecA [Bradymonadia bacterium]|jgi:recombination protein RecA
MFARQKAQPADRTKALGLAVEAIEKQFGKGSIWRLDGTRPAEPVAVHPIGCVGIDLAMGVGGLPAGRVVEIYGPESSGKTTLMLEVIAGVQAAGGVAAFVDAEHALDLQYAKCLGVDPAKLLVSQPDHGEQALEITDALVRSGAVDIVVIDSVAALVPRAELEGEMGDHHVGLQARLMSQALRKLTSTAARGGTTVVFINQLRHKIGVTFGSPETTTGGNALKFYASMRIDIRRIGGIKQGDKLIGNRTRVKIVKNKMAPPFRIAEFDIMFGTGINREGDALDQAVDADIVDKKGSWYAYNDERLGQGRENVCSILRERPSVYEAIKAEVMRHHGMVVPPGDAKPDAKGKGDAKGRRDTKPKGDAESKAA